MVKVTKRLFSDFIESVQNINRKFYNEMKSFDAAVGSSKVIDIEITQGVPLFENGKISEHVKLTDLEEEFMYSSFPLMMIVKGEFELFLSLEGDGSTGGLSSCPIGHAKPGDFLGIFETCDAMLGSPDSLSPVKPWSVYCGKRTSIVINYEKKPFKKKLKSLGVTYNVAMNNNKNHANTIYRVLNSLVSNTSLSKGDNIPETISRVVIFPQSIVNRVFEYESSFAFELIRSAWNHSKHIRDSQLLNIQWVQIAKNFEIETGEKLDAEALDFIKYIIMAGNGLAPVFVRVTGEFEIAVEEKLCEIEDDSLIFVAETLGKSSVYNSGFLPLKYHFSSTENGFFRSPKGSDTYVKKLKKIELVFSLLHGKKFGVGEVFNVEFFGNESKGKGFLPNGINSNTDLVHNDIHFKKRCGTPEAITKMHSGCNINDDFLFAVARVTKLK